jgi:hypothetical protein
MGDRGFRDARLAGNVVLARSPPHRDLGSTSRHRLTRVSTADTTHVAELP